MRRTLLVLLFLLVLAVTVGAEEVTLPAAASIVGGAPFFSDARAFNTSYTASLSVTATYRCFIAAIGAACPSVAPQSGFTLAPRESRAFNDIVASTFLAPNTAGGVEFEFSGLQNQLVVTSRLYSTSPTPTVGMFIPGLDNSKAFPATILTSIRNGGSGSGFRTNVGVFNPGDAPVSATFTIFDGNGAAVGTPVVRSVPAHSGVQVSGIFAVANAGTVSTADAVVTVSASGAVFSYAAVIDNATTDPIFVVGARDQTSSTGSIIRVVQVGLNGTTFTDAASGNTTTTIHVGDTVKWVWAGTMTHGVTAGTCTGGGGGYYGAGTCDASGEFASGRHSGPFEYSFTFSQAGTFKYYCDVHGSAMTGKVIVDP
jgi:plastocyanin